MCEAQHAYLRSKAANETLNPLYRRISGGSESLDGPAPSPIAVLRDIDQPFVFELRNRKYKYRLEFHDTSSPENWRLLRPDLVLICYDVSQRPSLLNMQRVVSLRQTPLNKTKPAFGHPFHFPPYSDPGNSNPPSLVSQSLRL